MAHEEKFELVRNTLISYCKECISENYVRMFDMWFAFYYSVCSQSSVGGWEQHNV
jgi:hypothetical protein